MRFHRLRLRCHDLHCATGNDEHPDLMTEDSPQEHVERLPVFLGMGHLLRFDSLLNSGDSSLEAVRLDRFDQTI